MFEQLERINQRPTPWTHITTEQLWNDEHTSAQMLQLHLNPDLDMASRQTSFIDHSVQWLANTFNIEDSTRICDFGCGPGLYTQRFAQHSAQVTGIDFSTRSISYARKKAQESGLEINYVHQNYLQFETPHTFNLITLIMCDFCALSPQQRATLLQKFQGLLTDDGAVILDVYTIAAFTQREETREYAPNLLQGFWSAEKYYGFLNTFRYESEKVVLDKYTLITKKQQWEIYNWLQYFSLEALRKEVEANGFTIAALYGDVAGKPYDEQTKEITVVLKLKH